ncbi:MAG TPA: hypothetical protein VF198_10315 [Vicinamibacterales bacterium]
MRVLVAGALANTPLNGGEAWVRLSWVLGLQALGLDVFFVEQIDPARLTNAAGCPASFEASINRAYFAETIERFGLASRACLICGDGEEVCGLPYADLLDAAADADLLVNISGHLRLPAVLSRVRRRAYVDIDPGFTQFWNEAGLLPLDGHDVYFTIGENIGRPDCGIPTCGLEWRKVRQPVVLDEWPASPPPDWACFTTVARWRGSFGRIEFGGRTFGQKAHEFRRFAALPALSGERFEIALDIHPADEADRVMLDRAGWRLSDPRAAAATPDRFRSYVQHSAAEFSVAQGIYVETSSGWFSDRTTRYLASGRPALVQDTGFTRTLPVGEGLLAFCTPLEASDGARRIMRDYDRHARAAAQIARELFAAAVVLPRFLEDAGAGER